MARVLGLDPGSRTTGWGLVEGDRRRAQALGFGCVTPARSLTHARSLSTLAAQLGELLRQYAPDVVVVETPFSGRFPKAALVLAEARGALLAELGRWGGEVVELEPARVKAVVVGNGRAEKQQVAYVVRHAFGLEQEPPADAADALALALCYLRGALP